MQGKLSRYSPNPLWTRCMSGGLRRVARDAQARRLLGCICLRLGWRLELLFARRRCYNLRILNLEVALCQISGIFLHIDLARWVGNGEEVLARFEAQEEQERRRQREAEG